LRVAGWALVVKTIEIRRSGLEQHSHTFGVEIATTHESAGEAEPE
jgi:hypothetical protein